MDRIPQRAQFQFREINRLATKTKYFPANFLCAQPSSSTDVTLGNRARLHHLTVFHPNAAPQQTLQTRNQNRQLKWLGQIIIRTRSKSLEHILGPPARREHQNRHVILLLAQQRRDIKSTLSRQHHVEHNHVEAFFFLDQTIERRL